MIILGELLFSVECGEKSCGIVNKNDQDSVWDAPHKMDIHLLIKIGIYLGVND